MNNLKLVLIEFDLVKEHLLRLKSGQLTNPRIDECIKAVDRAKFYLTGEEFSIQNKKCELAVMIDEVMAASYKIPDFDRSFIESLESYYEKRKTLTEGQQNALENLHRKLCQRKKY